LIDRLIHSLQALASPAETQLARFPDFVVRADELALDFSDALMLVSNRPRARLTAAQRGALELLDTHLGEMSGPVRPQLWTDDAVRGSPEWDTSGASRVGHSTRCMRPTSRPRRAPQRTSGDTAPEASLPDVPTVFTGSRHNWA
jgi:hypothetical protein